MVATIGGFVVATADLVGAWTDGTLDLREPGAWSALFAERRVPTGPGRDWWIRGLDKARGRLPA